MSTNRRQDAYKNKGQFKADELRRRREEAQVEIRKQKREESMAKRRNLDAAALSDAETDDEEAVGAMLDKDVSQHSQGSVKGGTMHANDAHADITASHTAF